MQSCLSTCYSGSESLAGQKLGGRSYVVDQIFPARVNISSQPFPRGLTHAESPVPGAVSHETRGDPVVILESVMASLATLEGPRLIVGDWPTDLPSPNHCCFHRARGQNHPPPPTSREFDCSNLRPLRDNTPC